jgi:tRNA 2-thiouridine synthesizing protein B
MLQLILNSPFLTHDLELALGYRQPDDPLVLMQDAVIAAVAPAWCERLAAIPLYVMQEDLQARGLKPQIGTVLDLAGLVTLIADTGSPQSWGS